MKGEKLRSPVKATVKSLKISLWIGNYLEVQPKINTQELIVTSAHYKEILASEKTLDIYINYLMYYTSRQHVKWKHLQVQVYIHRWFHDE